MLPDRVSNSGPLTYESGALLIALSGQAITDMYREVNYTCSIKLGDGYTESFSTSAGVKQGCIISLKLFNIYMLMQFNKFNKFHSSLNTSALGLLRYYCRRCRA